MSVKISKLENELIIIFDYSPERINKIKSMKGHRWNPDKKEWTVPFSTENFNILKKLFRNEQLDIDFINNEHAERIVKLMGYSFKTKKPILNI